MKLFVPPLSRVPREKKAASKGAGCQEKVKEREKASKEKKLREKREQK